jgi:hypothetical protein
MATNTMISNTKTDVFMFGYLLYEIWTSKKPWSGINSQEARRLVLEGKRCDFSNEDLPAKIANTIHACWNKDLQERVNMEEINKIFTPASFS